MKMGAKSTIRVLASIVFVLLFGLRSLSYASESNQSELKQDAQVKPALSSLAYFVGDWECSGKFDISGKTIDAHQRFEFALDGSWILFRHDDKPPFQYHSLSEWGWDAKRKDFVMIVQDSTGGVRLFRSIGWDSARLQWDGDAFDASSDSSQRFTFDRQDDRRFTVSYFTLKSAKWSRVDLSTCSKQ